MSSLKRTPPTVNTPSNKRLRKDEVSADITLDDAVKLLMSQFSETKVMIDELRTDINNKIEAVKTELESKLDLVSQDINMLKSECATKFENNDVAVSSLNERVDMMTHSIENLQNRSELIVSGIPFMSGENLNAYFNAICKQLGFCDDSNPLVDIRRMKSKALKDGTESLIVVQFALRSGRDDFYGAYLRTRNLNLRHLGLNSDRRVYINENLTVAARKIKVAALKLKKADKLASVYTKQGIVYVRKTTESLPLAVNSEEDLEKFS